MSFVGFAWFAQHWFGLLLPDCLVILVLLSRGCEAPSRHLSLQRLQWHHHTFPLLVIHWRDPAAVCLWESHWGNWVRGPGCGIHWQNTIVSFKYISSSRRILAAFSFSDSLFHGVNDMQCESSEMQPQWNTAYYEEPCLPPGSELIWENVENQRSSDILIDNFF